MRALRSMVLTAVCLPVAAWAQSSSNLQGVWVGTYATAQGGELTAQLTVAESTGVWRFLRQGNQNRKNPCLEKDFPIEVLSQSATDLEIKVNGAEVLQGCINGKTRLHSADGQTLQGTMGGDRAVSFTRK